MKKYVHKDIKEVKINFEELEDYIDKSSTLPICSFISLYRVAGLVDEMKKYRQETGKQIVPIDNIVCNFDTLDAAKKFVENQWKIYSIDIDADEHVFWKEDQYGHEKHYAKNLSDKIKGAVFSDFLNYCPGTDDDLEDDVFVFRIFEEVDVPDDEGDNCEEIQDQTSQPIN